MPEETVDVIMPTKEETKIYNSGNVLTVESDAGAKLHLFTVNGQKVADYMVEGGRIDIRIDVAGCYIAMLEQDGKQLATTKILVP